MALKGTGWPTSKSGFFNAFFEAIGKVSNPGPGTALPSFPKIPLPSLHLAFLKKQNKPHQNRKGGGSANLLLSTFP